MGDNLSMDRSLAKINSTGLFVIFLTDDNTSLLYEY